MAFSRIILIAIGLLLMASCDQQDPMSRITPVQLEGTEFWVPQPYFKLGPSAYVQQDISLQVLYPDFQPLRPIRHQLHDMGKEFDDVRILISETKGDLPAQEILKGHQKMLNATKHAGNLYDLKNYKSPNESDGSLGELFIEDDKNAALGYIICDREAAPYHSLCQAYYWRENYHIEISYEKKFLPNWKDIKDKTFSLIDRFTQKPASGTDTHSENNPSTRSIILTKVAV